MTGHERGIDMTELGSTERLLAEAERYSAHNYEPRSATVGVAAVLLKPASERWWLTAIP